LGFRIAPNLLRRFAYFLSMHPPDSSGLIASAGTIRVAAKSADDDDAGDTVEDRMRTFAQIILLASLSVLTSAALAFDNGQFENVPPDIRAWFKSVMAPNGVPCCDISDGHRTEYNFREGSYWVPIEGQWMAVPAHAIIRDRGNPVGEAVVWYVHHRGSIIISCFVPADAV
jgi:hypothetical protein